VAGEERTRQQHTKKRDERVTPGPNRGGYFERDGRPAVRNPKCRKTGASPGRAQMIRISPCQTQQCERSARGALAKEWGGKWERVAGKAWLDGAGDQCGIQLGPIGRFSSVL